MKRFLKIVALLFGLLILLIFGFGFYMTRGLEEGKMMTIHKVDLTQVKDGVYTGVYQGGRWSNQIRVTVDGHRITNLSVLKDVTFAKPELTKELFDEIINKQTNQVDTVSSATVTSKAYLKAIENALSGK